MNWHPKLTALRVALSSLLEKFDIYWLRDARTLPFNPELMRLLKHSGWYEGRDDREAERQFQEALGAAWIPQASSFVRSFGGLIIEGSLWVRAESAAYDLPERERVESFVGCSDYNIQAGQNEDKVGNVIELKLAIAGAAPKQ